MGAEIIGIPEKGKVHAIRPISAPEDWEFVVHDHRAKKAGPHFDLRLGDPQTGHAHSWALRYWPAPGEKRFAIAQSTHTIPYMDWEGTIKDGYGAGEVSIKQRGKASVSKTSPMQISFRVGPSEMYNLIRTQGRDGKAWLLVNRGSVERGA